MTRRYAKYFSLAHSLTLAREVFSYLQNIDVQLSSMIIQNDLMYECVFWAHLKSAPVKSWDWETFFFAANQWELFLFITFNRLGDLSWFLTCLVGFWTFFYIKIISSSIYHSLKKVHHDIHLYKFLKHSFLPTHFRIINQKSVCAYTFASWAWRSLLFTVSVISC